MRLMLTKNRLLQISRKNCLKKRKKTGKHYRKKEKTVVAEKNILLPV